MCAGTAEDLSSRYRLQGSALSPFSMKVEALLRHARLPYVLLPRDGTRRLALRTQARQLAVMRGLEAPTYPPLGQLRELPLVPYVFTPEDEILWDSTAIGRWLDDHPERLDSPSALLPRDPATRFACLLIDELFDELGLYVLHHVRWVTSGATTRAMDVLGEEYTPLLGAVGAKVATRRFARRQVRRLPYLFSVAAPGAHLPGVTSALQPPSRPGFPETHTLLDELFDAFLDASEHALAGSPYLFGERFSLADAALYGMMESIRRLDPTGAERMRTRAPQLDAWLERVGREPTERRGRLHLRAEVSGLLDLVTMGLVPLLQQNADAWREASRRGEARRRPERAFDAGRALYDGTLRGHAFRSVAKGFQVEVWERLRLELVQIPDDALDELWATAPGLAAAFGLDS